MKTHFTLEISTHTVDLGIKVQYHQNFRHFIFVLGLSFCLIKSTIGGNYAFAWFYYYYSIVSNDKTNKHLCHFFVFAHDLYTWTCNDSLTLSKSLFYIKGVQMTTRKKLCTIKGISEAKMEKIKEAANKLCVGVSISFAFLCWVFTPFYLMYRSPYKHLP